MSALTVIWSFCQMLSLLFVNRLRTKKLLGALQVVVRQYGFELDPNTKKRIYFYTAQSAITNHWFGLLRGKRPNKLEIQNALWLGAFTPIADDLMDETGQTFQMLESQTQNNSTSQVIFAYLLDKLSDHRRANPNFEHYFKLAHQAQNDSLLQLQAKPINLEHLERITFEKGGYYTTLYRFLLNNQPQTGEEKAIFTLGSILQILNDLFDVHKDFNNNVQTLVTRTCDMNYVAHLLEALEIQFQQEFFQLNYPKKNKGKSYCSIMFVVARGHIALSQFKKLQGDSPKINIGIHPRKSLIVDMEKKENIWKNLKAAKRALQLLNS